MRIIVAIASVILVVGLFTHPMRAQVQADIPALEQIYMIDSLTGWAVARHQSRPILPAHTLVRTVDGGTHWEDVTPPLYQAHLEGFFFFDPDRPTVHVFTSQFAWVEFNRTIDGGRTWKSFRVPSSIMSINFMSINFINARDGWVLGATGANMSSFEIGVYRSADGGETWTQIASSKKGDLSADDVGNQLTFLNATTGWITKSEPLLRPTSRGPDDYWFPLSKTTNGGRTWKQQKLSLPPQVRPPGGSGVRPPRFFTERDGLLPIFYANQDPNYLPGAIGSFVLYITHDSGATWSYTSPLSVKSTCQAFSTQGSNCVPRQPWAWALSFPDMDHGWVAESGGEETLYTTSDGGRQWTTTHPAAFKGVMQLDFVSSQVGWAVTRLAPFLLKTLDGGRTWTPVTYTISR